MSYWSILAGLLPLVLFVVIDSFCGPKMGILAAGVAAVLELILSLQLFKTVDTLTIGSLILVIVMGATAWKMKNTTIFKMQPVVVGLALALVLLISYTIDRPILTLLMTKYKDYVPKQLAKQLTNPLFIRWLNLSTLYSGWAILIQTGLVAWAALKLNNWWWIAFRGIGFYVFFIGACLLAQYQTFIP